MKSKQNPSIKKDLSFIIVNWNTKELLASCLKSVYETVPGNLRFETFVVDNGSTDGSLETVEKNFPSVILIKNKENLGFAKANNQALRQVSTPYAVLLNTDTLLTPGAINALFEFMESHPDVGIAGGQLLNQDGSKQNSFANFPSLATELLNKSLLQILFPGKYPSKRRKYTLPLKVDFVVGACMIVRTQATQDVGTLSEDYFFFSEETDWCFRMKKKGWKIYYLPSANIYHFQGQSLKHHKTEAKIEHYRSRYLFFYKNRTLSSSLFLKLALPLKLIVNFLFTLIFCLCTLFLIKSIRKKLYIYGQLLSWHIKGCPKGGLRDA